MSSATDWASDQGGLDSDVGNNSVNSDGGLKQAEATFVEWAPNVDGPPRQAPPVRVYHKKSKTGCAECRARRIKCDETHPICGNCQRSTGECIYDRPKTAKMNESPLNLAHKAPSLGTSKLIPGRKVEPPARGFEQSKAHHLLELRLLHRYMSETLPSLIVGNSERLKYLWTIPWPRKAFEHDALLNAMYAIAALHWTKLELQSEEAREAYRKYLDLTLSGHRDDVANLSKENADAVCLTSALVRTCIFSELSSRDLEPYTPPSVWLKSTQASGNVWAASWEWIADDETAIASALFKSTPGFMDPALMFHPSNRKGLNHLLRSNLDDDAAQLANPEIVSSYETTISFIGGIKLALAAGQQPRLDILKRLGSFPMWINRNFTPLVEECQPRALAILCHYFALLSHFKDFWWVANTGEREIRAIEKILPPQWLQSMAWPLQVLKDPSILTSGSREETIQIQEDRESEDRSGKDPWEGFSDLTVPFGAGFRGE
ncbi:hypothetical protein N431DRAFT_364787 [Stipitochalara longipes BDJ]|nr:hypothetical protein N431DRAFT_364787 [Stipitochalara longipes BDJ]